MFFRKKVVTGFEVDAERKLSNAVAFLANHAGHYAPVVDGEDPYRESRGDHRMPDNLDKAMNKACVAAALYIEQVFIEGL